VVTALFHRRSWRAVQELIASEARASHLAYHDPLTGLPNRVMFFDRLGVALDQLRRNGTPVAVHCLDLDRFKDVNDTFGHQIGDELIVAASKRIAEVCRRSDTFARLSGDEFAIVQLDATPHAAARLAERIVDAISQPMDLSSGRIHVSCSIGVNLLIEGEVSAADALRHADLALYRSKNNGRAQYSFFEPEMDAAMRMRREIETELREALYDGDLHMVYQPQADKHGRIAGVEALLRWHHPTRGDISPAMFIPIAEECGLINEVGMYTLREVFLASRKWDGLKVAVNISAAQLRMRDFPEKVAELLKECAVDPRTFELEITEGLLLGDDPVTHGVLKELRQMGFSIALDDFGTGYSSLSYLQRYPIDKIKIDRSFIANLGIERESVAVVQAIVKLARALRLDVIAEGVETTEQRDQLIDNRLRGNPGLSLQPPCRLCPHRRNVPWSGGRLPADCLTRSAARPSRRAERPPDAQIADSITDAGGPCRAAATGLCAGLIRHRYSGTHRTDSYHGLSPCRDAPPCGGEQRHPRLRHDPCGGVARLLAESRRRGQGARSALGCAGGRAHRCAALPRTADPARVGPDEPCL
jgi:diguanylate cyclase (GGDEF)-like protein